VRTIAIADPGDLLARLPDPDFTCWIRHGEGMVGVGGAPRATLGSPAEAQAYWQDVVASVVVEPDASLADEPMAAPVGFVSFPFAATGGYEVVVPRLVLGRRRRRAWVTRWGVDDPLPPARPLPPGPGVTDFTPGSLDRPGWTRAVSQAIGRIQAGGLDKVVLARDEVATAAGPIDTRAVAAQLSAAYRQTWTFAVAGLVGASPELLVRQDRGLITSRVLAGTIHGNGDHRWLMEALSSSSKDLAEHEYAVQSVADALSQHTSSLHVPEVPFVLQLPNVMHLASDITGAGRPGTTVVGLASAIHPSAAVCGTPTEQARRVIEDLEAMDRGRYAGPVGWINAAGDGEIALALRCGQIDGRQVRIFAGCGILADSDPAAEWAETVAKLVPMRQALAA
jgi:menaquinone-specific isochorismate synthase